MQPEKTAAESRSAKKTVFIFRKKPDIRIFYMSTVPVNVHILANIIILFEELQQSRFHLGIFFIPVNDFVRKYHDGHACRYLDQKDEPLRPREE